MMPPISSQLLHFAYNKDFDRIEFLEEGRLCLIGVFR